MRPLDGQMLLAITIVGGRTLGLWNDARTLGELEALDDDTQGRVNLAWGVALGTLLNIGEGAV